MKWVKYVQLVDKHAHMRRQKTVFVPKIFYVKIQHFIVICLPANPALGLEAPSYHLLCTMLPCKIANTTPAGHHYFNATSAMEVIDVSCIEGSVGRVRNARIGGWCVIEREGIYRRLDLADDDELEWEADVALVVDR
ncbi:hypothetical protein FRC03_009977 [Tulasnella sp. 419]|nr:hypothetical protein FRC03_009977 [Tulasnella sp. 419]